jgi:hypothetical protein
MQNKKDVKAGQQLPNKNLKSCKSQIELVYCNKSLHTLEKRDKLNTLDAQHNPLWLLSDTLL